MKKIIIFSQHYAVACNGWRGPSPRLGASATHLRRNIAAVESRSPHSPFIGQGIEPQTSRIDIFNHYPGSHNKSPTKFTHNILNLTLNTTGIRKLVNAGNRQERLTTSCLLSHMKVGVLQYLIRKKIRKTMFYYHKNVQLVTGLIQEQISATQSPSFDLTVTPPPSVALLL